MKIMNALLGAFFALSLSFAGEIRFEKPAQVTSWVYGPNTSLIAVDFDAVGGEGGGILNAVKIGISNEAGGAFKGARLVYGGTPVGSVIPFSGSNLWINIGAVLPKGAKKSFRVDLLTQSDLRIWTGMPIQAAVIDASTGGDTLTGLPITGTPFQLVDPRINLSIERDGDSLKIVGRGERLRKYNLHFTSDFKGWVSVGSPLSADSLGNFSRTFAVSELASRGFFRAERVEN